MGARAIDPRRGRSLFRRRRNRRVRLTRGTGDRGWWRRLLGRLALASRLALFLLVTLCVGAGALAGHLFVRRSSHFALRVLKISPTRHVSAEALAARTGVTLGSNLFSIDLAELVRRVSQEPWVASAQARLELPATLALEVVEHEPACAVALGALYLADRRGVVFKRASAEEGAGLPVVTGLSRDSYLADLERAHARLRESLAVLERWGERPRLGEVHFDGVLGFTVFTAGGGVGVRLGRPDESLAGRLARLDAVWTELRARGEQPRFIYVDNRARPDRVTVKLAAPAPPRARQERKPAAEQTFTTDRKAS